MSHLLVTKTLTDSSLTHVSADNDPLRIENYTDCGVLVVVTDATNGDKISVNLIGGLQADLMESMPMLGCPMTITIAAGRTSQLFTLNLRGIAFLQVKEVQTTGSGCTVAVYFGGGRR